MLRRYHAVAPAQIQDGSVPRPTVSVCVAARNETHALAQCLERILKSDYTKLEVLVLDDSSSDDTSLIIKSFAHAGVRFIPGKPLQPGWLGKNHAFQTLIDESSGDLLLFIDVDTIIEPATISRLVAELESHGSLMISVLPRRDDGYRLSAVAGTMRYYWELLLGTRRSPPASSAVWMIRSDVFDTDGVSFSNYAMSVRPERHLARQIHRLDGYRYVVGTVELGISYEKHLRSQYETAQRLYYPVTGRSTLLWMLATSFMLSLLAPPVIALIGIGTGYQNMWSVAIVLVTAFSFGLFVIRTYAGSARLIRILLGPLLVVQETMLLASSYVRYRHGSVTWKGRLVNAQPTRHDALEL